MDLHKTSNNCIYDGVCKLMFLIHAFLSTWIKIREETQYGWKVSMPEHWKIKVEEQISGDVLQLLCVSSG